MWSNFRLAEFFGIPLHCWVIFPALCASFCSAVTFYSSWPGRLRMVIAQVPEIRFNQSQLLTEPALPGEQPSEQPAQQEASAIRAYLLSRGNSALADRGFHWLMVLCALSIFGIVVLIATELVVRSRMAWGAFGLDFFYKAFIDTYTGKPMYWDPVNGHFSALPFLYGTLVSSFLALLLAVPLAIGVAVFFTEMCPPGWRAPLAFTHRAAGGHSQRNLRLVGGLRAGAAAPGARESLADQGIRLDGLFRRRQPHRPGLSGGGRDSGHHDSAHHLLADPRGDDWPCRIRSARRCWPWAPRAGR
jgi:hypothetical protein